MIAVLGIEKTEKLVSFGVEVAKAVVKSKEDGKFAVDDLAHFIPLVVEVGPVISAIAGLGDEIKAMTFSDVMELCELVLKKLDFVVSDKMAEIIKQAIKVVVEAAKLISVISV